MKFDLLVENILQQQLELGLFDTPPVEPSTTPKSETNSIPEWANYLPKTWKASKGEYFPIKNMPHGRRRVAAFIRFYKKHKILEKLLEKVTHDEVVNLAVDLPEYRVRYFIDRRYF